MRDRLKARRLSAEIDRLLSGQESELLDDGHRVSARGPDSLSMDGLPVQELQVARRIQQLVAGLPSVPAELDRRVRALDRPRPVHARPLWRPACDAPVEWRRSPLGTAALGALTTVLVLALVLILVPIGLGRERSWAQVVDVLLGQTRVELTPAIVGSPTVVGSSTLVSTPVPPASPTQADSRLAPQMLEEGAAQAIREPLRDLVEAELLIGRAPSTPKSLPTAYTLLQIAAVSYPDLPSWISQPFYIEMCYGPEGVEPDLRLRQYRLLFRDFGGISSVQVASEAVIDMEEVDISGAKGMLLTLSPGDGDRSGSHPAAQPTYTLLWERDGLLHELETDGLSRDALLETARSVR